jgi:hypothetical protein
MLWAMQTFLDLPHLIDLFMTGLSYGLLAMLVLAVVWMVACSFRSRL